MFSVVREEIVPDRDGGAVKTSKLRENTILRAFF
jgi:hypothetical protein